MRSFVIEHIAGLNIGFDSKYRIDSVNIVIMQDSWSSEGNCIPYHLYLWLLQKYGDSFFEDLSEMGLIVVEAEKL